jgi:hypothetical protein
MNFYGFNFVKINYLDRIKICQRERINQIIGVELKSMDLDIEC